MKWRDIKTAPQNRERVLLYFPVLPKHYDQSSKITVGLRIENGWWVTALGAGGFYDGEIEPTHWMPLPNPPEVNK